MAVVPLMPLKTSWPLEVLNRTQAKVRGDTIEEDVLRGLIVVQERIVARGILQDRRCTPMSLIRLRMSLESHQKPPVDTHSCPLA